LISAEEDGYARAAAALAAKYFGTQQKLDEATVWLDRANVLSLPCTDEARAAQCVQ
jgi:HEAT repeat protein